MNSYILLNNREASKYDLYLPGRLVAALHYYLDPAEHTMMFVYCEAIEKTEANRHCRELMRQATEHTRNRRLELTIPAPSRAEASKRLWQRSRAPMISSPPNGETQAMSNAEEYEDRAARIASELGELCETHQIVVGVAESLTGGKIASQLAAVPGSGNWFAGAVVAYFSDVKHQLLRVPRGPVISQTAAESMASSACTLLGSDAAVAASGAGALRARRGRSQARHGLLSLSARKCTPNDRSSPANPSRSSLRLRNGR